jgi:hypothetical protein
MDGTKPICFASEHVKNFKEPNPSIKWIELEPDMAIGKVKDHHKAGMISVKLSINDVALNGPIDFATFPAWGKVPKRPKLFKVRIFLYQCIDLPAADSDG